MGTRHAELLLAAGSLAVGLLALEGWARWREGRQVPGRKPDERARYTTFDETLGWALRPGARVVYERAEFSVEVAINSHGLRDPERRSGPDTFRVLALGDSFVEGYTVPLEKTVTQVLERRLDRPACPVEVWNAGTGGYSTDQEWLLYRRLRERQAPKVVLLFFYHNDVLSNARRSYFGTPKPLLRATDGGLVPVNLPLRPRRARSAEPDDENAPEPDRAARSALFAFVRDRLMRGAPRTYNRLAGWGLWPPLRGQRPPDTLRAYALRRSPALWQGWSVVGAVVEALRDDTARSGAHLLVVYVPSVFEVDERAWELWRTAYSLDERGFDRGAVDRRLSRRARRAGVDFLSLTATLRRAHRWWRPAYFRLDGHWNERGHRAAASAIEERLRERGWLPPCAARRAAGPRVLGFR